MPSLKPNRLRGVACARLVDDVRPKPSWDHRIAAVPNASRARLRIACTATCGSSAHACTQRSPSLRAGSSWSAGKCGSRSRARGLPVREPEPVAAVAVPEEPGPEAEGQREPGGGQPARLAGVPRRGVVRRALAVADRLPGGQRLGRRGPAFEQGDQLGPVLGGDVERGEVQPVLGGGDDPGLVLAVERHHRPGAVVPGDQRDATRARGGAERGPGTDAEQAPARDGQPAGHLGATAAARFARGSDSALTASESSLTSSSVRSV